MNTKQNKLFLSNLKELDSDIKSSNKDLKKIIELTDVGIVKQKKCKLCNKKYNSNNRFYGKSCLNNLYKMSNVNNIKEIDDKELYLHSAIILKLNKTNISSKEMCYVCESYLSRKYFDKINLSKLKIIKKELDTCIIKKLKPIMKLNTVYRMVDILNNNLQILKNLKIMFEVEMKEKNNKEKKDIMDIIIDTATLRFINRYFSLVKLNSKDSELYYYMQIVIWEYVVGGGLLSNYKFSAKCLSNALVVIGSKPKDIYIKNDDEYVISLIKNDNGFKSKIKDIIRNHSNNDKIIIDSEYSFDDGDLFYSLHSVKLSIDGIKINEKWNLKITIKDVYDYTELLLNNIFTKDDSDDNRDTNGKNKKKNKDKKKYITKGNILNDMAAISTQYGVLSNYNIVIEFDWNGLNAY